MWVTLERPMALGSMRYWDISTTALTPPSTGSLSCSTEMEMSRQAPRGRSVRQRLRDRAALLSSCPCVPTCGQPLPRPRGLHQEQEVGEPVQPKEEQPGLRPDGIHQTKTKPSRSGLSLPSPEHHAVPARVGCHAVRDVVVDLHVLVQGLHHFALQQVLIPEVTLPKHPVQHGGGRGLDLRGDLPQAQRVPIPNLMGQGKGQAGCPAGPSQC